MVVYMRKYEANVVITEQKWVVASVVRFKNFKVLD
jgi:hypothetical protein